jgi:glycosyltransferase involved in cell wall biosynthesis
VTRVLLVTPRYAPDVGGLESYVGWVAALLRDTPGWEVSALTTHPGRGDVREVVDGVTVHRLGTLATLSNTPVHPAWPLRLRSLVRAARPDVVNVHAPVPGLPDLAVLSRHGVPTVLTYHAGSLVKGGARVDPLLRAYERHVLTRVIDGATALVAVSPVALTWPTGRATMIPPGVSTALFTPAAHPRARRLVYAGRLERSSRWKGVHVLLEALASLPSDVVLDVAGTGDDLAWLQSEAVRHGVADRVSWHGLLSQPALAALHQRATATVLPSLTDSESFGMCLVEAMSCATAVVGSRVGGIPYVVEDGVTGLLVRPGSPVALASALSSLLDSPALTARLGSAGRAAAVERFDWAHQRARTLEVLALTAGRRTPAGVG